MFKDLLLNNLSTRTGRILQSVLVKNGLNKLLLITRSKEGIFRDQRLIRKSVIVSGGYNSKSKENLHRFP